MTAEAASDGSASISYQLTTGQSKTSWASFDDGRDCTRTVTGRTMAMSASECWLSVPWFAPQIFFPDNRSSQVVFENQQAAGANQFTIAVHLPKGQSSFANKVTAWSRVVLTVDASFLPATLTYQQGSDDGGPLLSSVIIRYSNYQTVAGAHIPCQIDRYVNGTLQASLSFVCAQS